MKKGDIVICVTNKIYGQKYPLNIGEKYIVDDIIEMSEKKIAASFIISLIQVCDLNKKQYGLYDDGHV